MANYIEYKTKQGDTFDIIALKFYNDEYKASLLMQKNLAHISTIIFDEGITLKIPMIEQEAISNLPPWR